MAEIAEGGGGGHGKGGKKRAKKQSTKIDMTPMVDLAFLLLTFFVLTSTFSKPKSMELSLPAEPPPNTNPPPIKNGVTFLLTKDDKIFYYKGEFYLPGNEKGLPATELKETNFSPNGLHKLLLDFNSWTVDEAKKLEAQVKSKSIADSTYKRLLSEKTADTKAITVLVKTDAEATYKNVIDMMDELKICFVGKRVLGVELMKAENELLAEKLK